MTNGLAAAANGFEKGCEVQSSWRGAGEELGNPLPMSAVDTVIEVPAGRILCWGCAELKGHGFIPLLCCCPGLVTIRLGEKSGVGGGPLE